MKSIINLIRIKCRVLKLHLSKTNIYQRFWQIIITGLFGLFILLHVTNIANGAILNIDNIDLTYESKDIQYLTLVPDYLREHVIKYTLENNIPISIFVRLIYFESRWDPNVISIPNTNGTKDYGLAQINGSNIKWFAKCFYYGNEEFNPMNPYHAVEACAKHLRYLNNIFLGNWNKTIKAYNCGVNGVLKNRIPKSTMIYADRIINENINII